MGKHSYRSYIKKLKPYNIVKGVRYLRHFGWKEFMVRLSERMEPEQVPYGPWYEKYRIGEEALEKQRRKKWRSLIRSGNCVLQTGVRMMRQ